MTWNRTQRWACAVIAATAVGCGPGEEPASDTLAEDTARSTAALTEVNAVRPNAVVARVGVRGVPDDVNLLNDVRDTASPDFDATYVEGNAFGSSIDLSYPVPTTGNAVVQYVNVKYFMRNAACTAPLICGRASSQLLRGNTVIATSAEHDLPDMTQGWYLFNDTYTLTTAQAVYFSELRTRIAFTWTYHSGSTTGIRLSTVASDFRY
jgi:hypothetical protein